MPTTLETPPPIAALSVQDAAITGERKSLHGNVTERVLRWAKAEKHIFSRPVLRYMAALGILGSQLGYAETSSAKQNPITAIDIALEPDATMIQHAEAVNARLLKVFPKGFALGATHHPHISILQRYVHLLYFPFRVRTPSSAQSQRSSSLGGRRLRTSSVCSLMALAASDSAAERRSNPSACASVRTVNELGNR